MTTTYCQKNRFNLILLMLSLALFTINTTVTIAQTTNPTSSQSDQTTQKTLNPKYRLLPEGYKIAGRSAKLIKLPNDTSWYLAFEEAIKYDPTKTNSISATVADQSATNLDQAAKPYEISPDPFARPIEILPCQWLTTMTKEAANRIDMSVDFRVWGEITTYQNINYILPTMVAQPPLFANYQQNQKPPSIRLQSLLNRLETKTQTTAEEADKSILPNNLQQALFALKEYQKTQNQSQYQQIQTQGKNNIATQTRLVNQNTDDPTKWKENQMILNRLGRIRYETEGGHWLFNFEADSQNLAEPPVILHPCQLLEVAEDLDSQTATMTKFILSGQIYIYQDRNYLLTRMVMKVYDSINIIKQ